MELFCLIVLIISLLTLLTLVFLLLIAFFFAVDFIFKFFTGSDLCLSNIKFVLRYRSFLGKALLWKFKIASKKGGDEIIERFSRLEISITDSGNDLGMKNMIVLSELEMGIKMLPPAIINLVNRHDAGFFTLNIVDSLGKTWDGSSILGRYFQKTNSCKIAKRSIFFLKDFRPGVIHELGHALGAVLSDERPEKFHYFNDWICFIEKIAEPPPTEYAEGAPCNEDFAETFMLYFTEPDYLEKKCPLRYRELERILQKANIKRWPILATFSINFFSLNIVFLFYIPP